MQNNKETTTFLKIQLKYRQVISNKFPKSFRDAGDLVFFYEIFSDFSG